METFEVYYEKFSFNPLKWNKKIADMFFQKQIKKRENARKNTHKYMRELSAVLKQRGYSIHKHDFSYTVRKDRKVGLENAKSEDTKYIVGPFSKIPYVRVLFTKAHEVGHVLQWNEDTNETHDFEKQYNSIMNAKTPEEALKIEDINSLWRELNAWARGLAFIPDEFKVEYKKYAKKCYGTYQDHHISYYNKESKEISILLFMLDPANTQY
jgi:hypothetical protein